MDARQPEPFGIIQEEWMPAPAQRNRGKAHRLALVVATGFIIPAMWLGTSIIYYFWLAVVSRLSPTFSPLNLTGSFHFSLPAPPLRALIISHYSPSHLHRGHQNTALL